MQARCRRRNPESSRPRRRPSRRRSAASRPSLYRRRACQRLSPVRYSEIGTTRSVGIVTCAEVRKHAKHRRLPRRVAAWQTSQTPSPAGGTDVHAANVESAPHNTSCHVMRSL